MAHVGQVDDSDVNTRFLFIPSRNRKDVVDMNTQSVTKYAIVGRLRPVMSGRMMSYSRTVSSGRKGCDVREELVAEGRLVKKE